MLVGDLLEAELDEDATFADWAEVPLHGVLLE
jgi:hypothetical protein